jgi:membrane-bound metal-dependent hydrolase YbcI (DUF457 family)
MDNLAHSLAGGLIGAGLFPQEALRSKRRLFLASIAVVNLPDVDILLGLWSKEVYFFHHRGFTHSFIGLLIMIPVAYWLARWILGPATTLRTINLYGFVCAQLLLGHFFLDFLTTYGTMFLYPFTMQRFSFPLMFIIDPLFWTLTALSAWVCYRQPTTQKIRRVVAGSGFAVACLWAFELHLRHLAQEKIPAAHLSATRYIYPAPLAPWAWNLTLASGEGVSLHYTQGFVSLWGDGHTLFSPIEAPYQTQLCPQLSDSPLAQQAFERYKQWGEQVVCKPGRGPTGESSGCQCSSLKYATPDDPSGYFGTYWIGGDGHTEFVSRNSAN